MPVDEGVRDAYLTMLKNRLESLRGEREKLRTRIDEARLADGCWAVLTPEQQAALAEYVEREDTAALVARRQEVVTRIQALQALIDAVRGAV